VHNSNEKNGSGKSTLQIMMAKCLVGNPFLKLQLSFEDLDIFLISPIDIIKHYYKSGVQFISLNHYGTLELK
jgi:hypothetical protein